MNLMIDLETIGTRPTSGILSIGVCPFTLEEGIIDPTFYTTISMTHPTMLGFTRDKNTMDWWDRQDPNIRAEAFSGKLHIEDALVQLSEYINAWKNPAESVYIWGNGADFDNVLLANAYTVLGIELPWSFRNNRCYRTLKALYPIIAYTKPTTAHNALSDAVAQATHAVSILKWISRHA